MTPAMIPQNYQEWQHCITVECGIQLTPSFIAERISALQNPKDFSTKKFVQIYGPQHLQRVLSWFEQAKQSV